MLSYPTQADSDVCVDMSPVIGDEDTRGLVNGRLAQPGDDKSQLLLKSIVHSKQKVRLSGYQFEQCIVFIVCVRVQESLMEVSRGLLDSLSQEGLSVKLTGKLARPSAAQLKAFLHQFKYVKSIFLVHY